MCRLYSADSQATISSSYMWLKILWSDNFAEFDQIPRLQNLDKKGGIWVDSILQIPKPLSVPLMWLHILWSDNFAEFDQIPHLQNLD